MFCGINNFKENKILNYDKVAGIKEEADYEKTIDVMLKVLPNLREILIILDNTVTGNLIAAELKSVLPKLENKVEIDLFRDFTTIELEEKISSLDKETSAIYLLTFNKDRENRFYTYSEGMRKIKSVSSVPIFGSWDFYLGKGIVGGVITSGYEQGKGAAEIVEEYLSTKNFPSGKVLESKNMYIFDYKEMKKSRISTKQLPVRKKYINKKNYYFENFLSLLISEK